MSVAGVGISLRNVETRPTVFEEPKKSPWSVIPRAFSLLLRTDLHPLGVHPGGALCQRLACLTLLAANREIGREFGTFPPSDPLVPQALRGLAGFAGHNDRLGTGNNRESSTSNAPGRAPATNSAAGPTKSHKGLKSTQAKAPSSARRSIVKPPPSPAVSDAVGSTTKQAQRISPLKQASDASPADPLIVDQSWSIVIGRLTLLPSTRSAASSATTPHAAPILSIH